MIFQPMASVESWLNTDHIVSIETHQYESPILGGNVDGAIIHLSNGRWMFVDRPPADVAAQIHDQRHTP